LSVLTICEENETEVSLFNRELYEKFKLNPEVRPLLLGGSFLYST
jgi:hypothetical protein